VRRRVKGGMGDRSTRADSDVVVAADIGGRTFCYFIDTLMFCVAAFVVLSVLSLVHGPVVSVRRAGNLVDRMNVDDVRFAMDTAIVSLLSGLYYAGSWWRRGATPGQRLCRIEVRPADRCDDAGARVPLARAVVRWLALGAPLWVAASVATGNLRWTLWFAAWAWYLLLAVTVARGTGLQGLHDRLSRTAAIRIVHPLEAVQPVAPPMNLVPVPADA
jgi:hypothetical protein